MTSEIEKLKKERRELKIEIRRLRREIIALKNKDEAKKVKGFFDKMIVCKGDRFETM